MIAVWNLLTLLLVGDITASLFWVLVIDAINLPIIILIQLVWSGKYNALNYEKLIQDRANKVEITHIKALADVQQELALLRQETEYLKQIQEQQHVIGELNEQLQKQKQELLKEMTYERDIAQYQLQLAARDENIRQAICRNSDWTIKNDIIGLIEREMKKEDAKTTDQ